MTSIGANEVTVRLLPSQSELNRYILVPLVFLIGNVLSLVIQVLPTAIILLATLYPVLRQAGMSPLTAAAVIATTATVMPTPLGGDNVAVATELAKYPAICRYECYRLCYPVPCHERFVPTLIVMAVVHFWQKFMDKKNTGKLEDNVEVHEVKTFRKADCIVLFIHCFHLPDSASYVVYIIRSNRK